MNRFSFSEIQRRDLVTSLMLWMVAEFVGLLLFPSLGVIDPGAKLRTWFIFSLPFGLLGSVIIAMSSRWMAIANEMPTGNAKSLLVLIGQMSGWVGLIGVLYPLIMAIIEFFTHLKLPKS